MTLQERKQAIADFIKAEAKIAEKNQTEIKIGKLSNFTTTGRDNYMFTGILGFDLNTYGFKKGTFNVIYGQESGGKSTLTLEACAGMQLSNPDIQILYVDSESTVDETFVSRIPYLNQDNIYFMKDNLMERIFGKIEELLEQKLFDVVVIDSIDTMVTMAEKEKSLEDNTLMDKARILSRALARLNDKVSENGVTVFIIQQERINMTGQYQVKTHGRSGGNALKFYPSVIYRIGKKSGENELADPKSELQGAKVVSQFVQIFNDKSKISEAYKNTSTYINTDIRKRMGVQKVKELTDYAIQYGLIKSSGAWFEMIDGATGEIIKIQGQKKVYQRLAEDLDLYSHLKIQTYATILPPELLIVQFENLKRMLERENAEIKKQKIDLSKALGKENLLTEKDLSVFEFGPDFTILNLLDEETYKTGLFNISNTYNTEIEKKEPKEKKEKSKKTKEKTEELNEQELNNENIESDDAGVEGVEM